MSINVNYITQLKGGDQNWRQLKRLLII